MANLARRTGVRLPAPRIDTAGLCRAADVATWDGRGEPSLELVANTLGLPVYSPHHALGDALTTAVVFFALGHQLARRSTRSPYTVGDLAAVSRRFS